MFFFSSRIRHTRFALVTGVQTCALPICSFESHDLIPFLDVRCDPGAATIARLNGVDRHLTAVTASLGGVEFLRPCRRRCVATCGAGVGARCTAGSRGPGGLLTARGSSAKAEGIVHPVGGSRSEEHTSE